jgi:hypothetical protein
LCSAKWTAFVIAAMLTTAVLEACNTNSAQRVTSMSIAPRPRGSNLLSDGGFEQPGTGAWVVNSVRGVSLDSDRAIRAGGVQSLRLRAIHAVVPASIAIEQNVSALPQTHAGARYVLHLQVRTAHLNRRVHTELKLNYAGGGYAFFSGRPITGKRAGIPRGTSARWRTVIVHATARYPLESIDAFVLDTGPGKLNGSVWLDDADLRIG